MGSYTQAAKQTDLHRNLRTGSREGEASETGPIGQCGSEGHFGKGSLQVLLLCPGFPSLLVFASCSKTRWIPNHLLLYLFARVRVHL